jgi:Family of unknown function (DUF6502)
MTQRALAPDAQASLVHAIGELLAPLARLGVSHGLPFATVEELFKRAYVDAARSMQVASEAGQRDISRVSTTTGLNRREVTRLTQERPPARTWRPSPATQIFTRWRGDPALQNKRGQPRSLPRQGPAPSFEALAQSVTRDVHPRSLLEELCRLGLAELDASGENVHLVRNAFVPADDAARLFGFVGANVGDHLSAAVANVLVDPKSHFEQAVFADGLSAESIQAIRAQITAQWQSLMQQMVPAINALIEADERARDETGRRTDQRLRIGLYSYHAPMPASTQESEES